MSDQPTNPAVSIPLVEESITVSKRTVETGRVRIKLRTETEEVLAQATLFDQTVVVDRIAIGREIDAVPPVREVGDVTIFPVVEEVVVVETRLVLKEELHVRRITTHTQVQHPVTLRRQVAEVDRQGPQDVKNN